MTPRTRAGRWAETLVERFAAFRGVTVVFPLLVAGLALLPSPVQGQSLLAAGGLGIPLDPIDARSRALGSVGLGLMDPSITPADPAAAADLRVPAATFSLQSSWIDATAGDDAVTGEATRFPLIGIAYPVGGLGMATVTFGGFLDQRWDVQREHAVDLGDEEALVTDSFISDGGVSALRVGFARRISPSLALGVSAGRYMGDLNRTFTRAFDSLGVEEGVPPFQTGGRWSFSGATLTGGAQVDLADVVRLSGSVSWSGALEADPDAGTSGGVETFDIPLQLRLGATGVLAPGLTLSAGVSRADWSGSAEDAPGGGGTAVLDVGAGVEFAGATLLGRPTPIRLGYSRRDLPFRYETEGATESILSAGLGLNLAQAEGIPLARIDLAVERGGRSGGSISEDFWRSTLTIRIAGF